MTRVGRAVKVFVEAPARLHFGVLDLRGELGRWFGGIGAAAPAPALRVSGSRAEGLSVTGADAARVEGFARRMLEHHGIEGGVSLSVHRCLPPHAGLGSGTQLALSVGRIVAELYGLPSDVRGLARALGRGARSGIGTYVFDTGGFVVEGGRERDGDEVAPLLARVPFPPGWRCVVAVPEAAPGVNGRAEYEAFRNLPLPPQREVERVAHLALMALLPALADADLSAFGASLTEIQTVTGGWFAPAQGGIFAPGPTRDLVRSMLESGAVGVGQSSWGPTVYGIVAGDDAARELAGSMRRRLGGRGAVYQGRFPDRGARVWRSRSSS